MRDWLKESTKVTNDVIIHAFKIQFMMTLTDPGKLGVKDKWIMQLCCIQPRDPRCRVHGHQGTWYDSLAHTNQTYRQLREVQERDWARVADCRGVMPYVDSIDIYAREMPHFARVNMWTRPLSITLLHTFTMPRATYFVKNMFDFHLSKARWAILLDNEVVKKVRPELYI